MATGLSEVQMELAASLPERKKRKPQGENMPDSQGFHKDEEHDVIIMGVETRIAILEVIANATEGSRSFIISIPDTLAKRLMVPQPQLKVDERTLIGYKNNYKARR